MRCALAAEDDLGCFDLLDRSDVSGTRAQEPIREQRRHRHQLGATSMLLLTWDPWQRARRSLTCVPDGAHLATAGVLRTDASACHPRGPSLGELLPA